MSVVTDSTPIAIIGVGKVGGALGRRFTASGLSVVFGVRAGKDVSELLETCGARATSAAPDEAARAAEVVFLAVPGGVAVEVTKSLGDLTQKIVVDCNNPIRWENGPVWAPPPEGSLSAAIAAVSPGARVVKAFNTFGAEFHEDPRLKDGAVDVLVAADDTAAKATVSRIAETAGFVAIDAGSLRNASALENFATLWIHIATFGGQGREIAFKLLPRR